MRRHSAVAQALCAAVTAFLCAHALPPAFAQTGVPDGPWPTYGGDAFSSKYSGLDQINADNFTDLKIAWRWVTADSFISKSEAGGEWWAPADTIFEALQEEKPNLWRNNVPPRIASLKATPLMIDGVLYLTTALYQAAAVDAATGKTLWVYNPRAYETGTPTMSIFWSHRGVAYWEDVFGEEKRVYWGTGDGYLVCVDATTGRPVEDFGEGGRVDLTEGVPRANRDDRDYLNALLYSCASPPIVVGDTIITGQSIADKRISKEAVPGWVRAWDVETGEHKWDFHTIPLEGEFGNETWEADSWQYSGNTNVWTQMSADPELGYVYLPIGTPTNDFYGGHRLGDNLFAESLVCVNAETGERVWHFQTVHHGLWDYDLPAAPNLLDITVDGRDIKAVAQITKQGFVFVFDRVTGEPVWPIEEREVPPSDIPGEVASPTQPFPTKPAPFEYQGVSADDVIDFTPELKKLAQEELKQYKIGPLFTPPSLPQPGGTVATIQRPGLGGGANWEGAAVDPETGILYVTSANAYSVMHMWEPDPKQGGSLRYTHGGRGPYPRGPEGLPLFKPPYSRITAIDLNTGEHVWMAPLGNGDHIRQHPLLKDLDLPPLGGDGRGAPLLTKTLLIVPTQPGGRGSDAGQLTAFNKTTGAVVGVVDLPASAIGAPMTYEQDGRQYIAVTVSTSPPELLALALPD